MGCLNHDLPYSIDNPSEKPRERHADPELAHPGAPKIVGVSQTIHHLHYDIAIIMRKDEDTPTRTIVFTITIGSAGQVGRIRDNHPQ